MQNTKDAALIATDPIESENAPSAALVVVSGGAEVVFVEGSNVGIVVGVELSDSGIDCVVGIPELIISSSASAIASVGAPLASVGLTVGGRLNVISSTGMVLSGHG